LFGPLSTSFFAAALLTVLDYLVFEVVGFQRRFVTLGTLRALELSTRQRAGQLAGELADYNQRAHPIGTFRPLSPLVVRPGARP
jgi:hypothetical protein